MNHAMTTEKPCPFCKFVARSPQELGTHKLEVHRIRATPDGPEIVGLYDGSASGKIASHRTSVR